MRALSRTILAVLLALASALAAFAQGDTPALEDVTVEHRTPSGLALHSVTVEHAPRKGLALVATTVEFQPESTLALYSVVVEGHRRDVLSLYSATVEWKLLPLTVGRGTANPPGRDLAPGEAGAAILQMELKRRGGRGTFTLESVRLAATGSLDDATRVREVRLVHDQNGDGLAGQGEPILGAGAFSSDDGTVQFNGLSLTLGPNEALNLLAVVDLAAGAEVGRTFSLSLLSNANLSVRDDRGTTIPPDGAPVQAEVFTVASTNADTTPPTITPINPVHEQIFTNVASTVFDFQAQDEAGGSGLRSASALLDQATRLADGQALNLAAMQTGQHRIDFQAQDNAGNVAQRSVLFFVQRVTAMRGDRTPADANVPAGRQGVVAMQFAIDRGGASDGITLESVRVRASGSLDDAAGIQRVRLARDVNGDGAFDAGDTLLGASMTLSGNDGTATFASLALALPPDARSSFLVLLDFAPGAAVAGNVRLSLDPASDLGLLEQGTSAVVPQGGAFAGPLLTVVEGVPPTVTILSPGAKTYSEVGILTLDYRATDNAGGSGIASIDAQLDGEPATQGQQVDLSTLARGPHLLAVTATDIAGNSASASVGFLIGSPQEALQIVTNDVVALLAQPGLSAQARRSIQGAIDLLSGNNPNANNGALQKLRDGELAQALGKIKDAVKKLARAQQQGADTSALQSELAQFAHETVKVRVIEFTLERGATDARAAQARQDFFDGEAKLAAGDLDGAIQQFRAAEQRVQNNDAQPPDLEVVSPFDQQVIQGSVVSFDVQYTDLLSLAVRSTFRATLDGTNVTSQFTTSGFQATATLTVATGVHTLTVTIADTAGNVGTATRTFYTALHFVVEIVPLRGRASLTAGDLFDVSVSTFDALNRPVPITGPIDVVFTGLSAPEGGLDFPTTIRANLIDGVVVLDQVEAFLAAGVQRATVTWVANPLLTGSGTSLVKAGPPCHVVDCTPDKQAGNIDTVLPSPLTAGVTDAYGNPLAGVAWTWTFVSGNAFFDASGLQTADVTIQADGSATSPVIRLGHQGGMSEIDGTVEGVVLTRCTVTALAPGGGDDDGDGLTNADEARIGTNPFAYSTAGDGLTDRVKVTLGLNPFVVDTDRDGLSDYDELIKYHTDPLVPTGVILITDPFHTKPMAVPILDRSPARFLPLEPFLGSIMLQGPCEIEAGTGEEIEQVTDLTIPGRGFDFSFTRTYRSQITFNGPIGHNWDYNYLIHLDVDQSGNVTLYNGGGRGDTYVSTGDGSFQSANGHFFVLRREGPGYTLTAPQGMVHEFDAGGNLVALRDRNLNEMRFHHNDQGQLDVVTDTLSRDIRLLYGLDGRISELRDFAGRSILYGYDGYGDLVSVRSPVVVGTPTGNDFPGGKTVGYTYHNDCVNPALNNNLATVTDAEGQVFLVHSYDAEDREVKEWYGTGTFTVDYDTILRITTLKDRRGNRTQYSFDASGHMIEEQVYTRGLRPGDPASFRTTHVYNAEGLLTLTTYPRGNSVEYEYDSANPDRFAQANLLRVTRHSNGIPGDQADVTVRMEYEPRFQFPKRVSDPRDGGAFGRFTTSFVFDYEQGSGNAGNVVEVHAPNVTEGLGAPAVVGSRMAYNGRGQLISTEDPEGNVTEYDYYPDGDPSGLADASARAAGPGGYLAEVILDARNDGRRSESAPLAQIHNSWTYDLVGNRTSWKDGKSQVTAYVVNSLNEVVRRTSRAPFSYVADTFYDANDNVERVVEANDTSVPGEPQSYTTRYEFDILDNVTKVHREAKTGTFLTTEYVRNENESIEEVRYPEGNLARTSYDERELVVERTRGYGSAHPSTTQYFVDANGNLERVLDGTGDETSTVFDGFDRVKRVKDGVGGVAELLYDPASNVLTASFSGTIGGASPADRSGARNALLARVTSRFDELSRPYRVDQSYFDPRTGGPIGDGAVTTQRRFDRAGRMTRVVNDNNHGVDIFYDGVSRRVLARDALSNEVEAQYDANSNPERIIERERPSGGGALETFTTVNVFDELDRLTMSVDPGNHVRQSRWDSRGNRVRFEDAEGNVTRWAFDGLDRATRIERDVRAGGTGGGALQRTIAVQQAWDGNSRLESTTDDNQHSTTYHWDALDRLEQVIYADRTTRRRTYTADDRVDLETDQNGTVVKHFYDHLDRLTSRVVASSKGVIGSTFEKYEWDGLSRLTRGENDDSVVTSAFDSLSRVIEETQNGQRIRTMRDGVGNPVDCVYPGGRTIHRAFDSLERVQEIDDTGNALAAYEYKGPWRPFKRTTGNGIVETTSYDNDRRVTSKTHVRQSDSAVVAGFEYGYNREEQKLFEKVLHPSAQGPAGSGEAYTYDSLYRLRTVKYGVANPAGEAASPGSSAFARKSSYDLDGVGNWSGLTKSDGNGGLISFIQPVANEMNEYQTFGTAVERHDDNGNRVEFSREVSPGQFSSQQIAFDFRDRPVEVYEQEPARRRFVAAYKYDVFNRRIEKQSGGVTTRFFCDGWRCVEEQGSNGATLATYVDGPQYLDEHVSMDRGGARYYLHSNTLYSVAALTDSLGSVVERYSYDVYGTPTIESSSGIATSATSSAFGNPYLFTGHRWDPETGLYYARNNELDPTTGRWIAHDRAADDRLGNLYGYAQGNPVNLVDPLGLGPHGEPDPYDIRSGVAPKGGHPWRPGNVQLPSDDPSQNPTPTTGTAERDEWAEFYDGFVKGVEEELGGALTREGLAWLTGITAVLMIPGVNVVAGIFLLVWGVASEYEALVEAWQAATAGDMRGSGRKAGHAFVRGLGAAGLGAWLRAKLGIKMISPETPGGKRCKRGGTTVGAQGQIRKPSVAAADAMGMSLDELLARIEKVKQKAKITDASGRRVESVVVDTADGTVYIEGTDTDIGNVHDVYIK